jgi:ribonuclease P protein component
VTAADPPLDAGTDPAQTRPTPPRPRFRFPKAQRILLSADFVRVRREGATLKDGVLRLGYFVRGDEAPPRLGLAVSRRAGNAVARNRIKRVIREAFRLHPGRFPNGLDLVVVPMDPKRAARYHEVDAALERLARRLRRRLAESSR